MIKLKPYLPTDAVILTGDRMCAELAQLNQISGPGFTLCDGNRPLASGGVRIYGVAEAWFVLGDEAKEKYLLMVMRKIKKELEKIQRREKLYKIYAEDTKSENFLQHLRFVKKNNIFVR